MMQKSCIRFIKHFAGCVAALLLAISCSTLERAVVLAPDIPGAHFMGNKACGDCHTNYARVFTASAHARVLVEQAGLTGGTGCESCHGPGSKHIEAGGGRRFITNPGRDPESCLRCHETVRAEFTQPQHHPVPEGKMNCVQCHDPHGRQIMKPSRRLAMSRVNETCAQCHREQVRPVAFEHEALREGCTACHHPHGAATPKMLKEADDNLCLKCHAQTPGSAGAGIYIGKVPHALYLQQGACWTSGCHSAVHGSNISPRMRY